MHSIVFGSDIDIRNGPHSEIQSDKGTKDARRRESSAGSVVYRDKNKIVFEEKVLVIS